MGGGEMATVERERASNKRGVGSRRDKKAGGVRAER
jgi:hypothetical protein